MKREVRSEWCGDVWREWCGESGVERVVWRELWREGCGVRGVERGVWRERCGERGVGSFGERC